MIKIQVDKGEEGYEEFEGRSALVCTMTETETKFKVKTGAIGPLPDVIMMLESLIENIIDDTPTPLRTPLAMLLVTSLLDKCPEVLITEEMHTLVEKIMEERDRIGLGFSDE